MTAHYYRHVEAWLDPDQSDPLAACRTSAS